MNTSKGTSTPSRTRWGRSRFGGSGRTLIAGSIALGLVLSAGLGGLFAVLEPTASRPLAFGVGVAMTLPFSILLVWVLLVDRSTLAGAPDDPEASIESHWYDRAASGAFTDLIIVLGLGSAVFSFLDLGVSTALVLGGLFVIAAIDVAARYLIAKRADG